MPDEEFTVDDWFDMALTLTELKFKLIDFARSRLGSTPAGRRISDELYTAVNKAGQDSIAELSRQHPTCPPSIVAIFSGDNAPKIPDAATWLASLPPVDSTRLEALRASVVELVEEDEPVTT